tara:strand:+ start:3129 stop:3395 length:267 start_codon:yes stop_codon:yes gene_type:complete
MDNIQFEIKEKGQDVLKLTETNKKVSFNNTVQVKTIPNNDQVRELQNIYGKDLDKERENQKKILQDIQRRKQMAYFLNLQVTLNQMKR